MQETNEDDVRYSDTVQYLFFVEFQNLADTEKPQKNLKSQQKTYLKRQVI